LTVVVLAATWQDAATQNRIAGTRAAASHEPVPDWAYAVNLPLVTKRTIDDMAALAAYAAWLKP
jgi:hypothetical protein